MIENNGKNNTPQENESTLFSEPTKPVETLNSKRKKNLLKKQMRLLIIIAAVIAAAILSYIFVVLPMVNTPEEIKTETVEKLPHEVIEPTGKSYIDEEKTDTDTESGVENLTIVGGTYNHLMFERCARKNIAKVEVHNEHGEFEFYWDEEYEMFCVTGHPAAPYDAELFASFIVSTGITNFIERIHTECDNLEEYGLADTQNPSWYKLTTRDGNEHTVYIGDATPAGSGYYARYKDSKAVYVLSAAIGNTVLKPLENMITPQITLPMSENDYFALKDFTLLKNGEREVTISFFSANEVPPEELKTENAAGVYKMLYPTNYEVNTVNYATALETFINFTGTKTVKFAPSEDDLKEYGLFEPARTVYYKYKDIEQLVAFSELTDDGTYYVYSPMYNLIAEVSDDALGWLDWKLINWVDLPMFMMNINDVQTISVKSDTAERIFDLSGTGEGLVVTERTTGFKPEVKNFRQFYRLLITTNIWGYISDDRNMSEEKLAELVADGPYLTLTIETREGESKEFKIYPYSTNYAYYTENGEGEFCILRERAEKIVSDAEKVMTNTTIDADAHD